MKKYFPLIILLLAIIFSGCKGPVNQIDESLVNAELKEAILQKPALTEDEADDLIYMREEEKLARDVYLKLFEQYEHQIFERISKSEEIHTAQILKLLDNYNLEDPAKDLGVGEFKNPVLQKLFDDLIKEGFIDLNSALNVGVLIEETDIVDIGAAMERTDQPDILNVYGNLLEGSLNHLEAFEKVLKKVE